MRCPACIKDGYLTRLYASAFSRVVEATSGLVLTSYRCHRGHVFQHTHKQK